MAHVDMESLGELKEVMEEDFTALVETFIQDTDKRVEHMEQCLIEGNAEEVRKIAHSMKGSSSNLFAPTLSALCHKLEECGRTNALEGTEGLWSDIKQEYDQVRAQLQETIETSD